MEERTGEFRYYLKRYRITGVPADVDPLGELHDGAPVWLRDLEAGAAYKEDDGAETIYIDGFWNGGEAKVYRYDSPRASADDGWIID